jgi:hypothetical protein
MLDTVDALSTAVNPFSAEDALHSTNKASAYAAARTRLANQNLSEAELEPWVEFLLYSRPALGNRIASARCR